LAGVVVTAVQGDAEGADDFLGGIVADLGALIAIVLLGLTVSFRDAADVPRSFGHDEYTPDVFDGHALVESTRRLGWICVPALVTSSPRPDPHSEADSATRVRGRGASFLASVH
jgi:hypothetical protein